MRQREEGIQASVIISDVTSQGQLIPCLLALCNQDVLVEILLPDEGAFSREDSERLEQLGRDYPQLKVMRGLGNRCEAFNVLAKKAKADILLFIESHCIAERNWAREHITALKKAEVTMGQSEVVPSDFWESRCETLACREQRLMPSFLDFHNTGMTKKCFERMGGLTPTFMIIVEFELGARLHQRGIKVKRIPARVWHYNDTTMRSYSRVVALQGEGRTQIIYLHGKAFSDKYFPNPRLTLLLPVLRSTKYFALGVIRIALEFSFLGFKCAKKINSFPLALFWFKRIAKNSLRLGELRAVR